MRALRKSEKVLGKQMESPGSESKIFGESEIKKIRGCGQSMDVPAMQECLFLVTRSRTEPLKMISKSICELHLGPQ